MSDFKKIRKAALLVLMTAFLFSTYEVVAKPISHDFSPLQLTFSRFLIGGIVLIPPAFSFCKKHHITLAVCDIKQFCLLGFICVVASMVLYQCALLFAQASDVAVLFSCNSIFVMLFSVLLLRAKMTRFDSISLVLLTVGIFLIVDPFSGHTSPIGALLLLGSALFFGLYSVLAKKEISKVGSAMTACGSFIAGGLMLCAIALIGNIACVGDFLVDHGLALLAYSPFLRGYTASNIFPALYLYLAATGLGYWCFFKSIELTSPVFGSLAFFFKPVFTPVMALLVLHDSIPPLMLAGIIVILIGSGFSLFPNLKKSLSSGENKMRQKH